MGFFLLQGVSVWAWSFTVRGVCGGGVEVSKMYVHVHNLDVEVRSLCIRRATFRGVGVGGPLPPPPPRLLLS